jgi:uncharacterized membrane protein
VVSGVARAVASLSTPRKQYVDLFRGLLIAHMALDHASLFFNAGRDGEELAAAPPALSSDVLQFLTRFTGVPVAPAFCFMAGFMVALTSLTREARGAPAHEVTRRLIVRGLVLIGVDTLVMGLPRAAMGFYSFMVLSSIGVSLIALAFLRRLPTRVLLPAALAVLLLHPLLDVSALPLPLRAVLYEPVRTGHLRSMYPVIPWGAIVLLGFVVGRDAANRRDPRRTWLVLAGVSLATFFVVRLLGGYGNAYSYPHVLSLRFWFFAKYPPDLPFVAWSFTVIFTSLAALRTLTKSRLPSVLRIAMIFGRVPFFFYVVHFFVLGIGAGILHKKLGLGATYAIWLALLAVMVAPCAWYYRKKTERPNFITRYL